MTDTCAGAQRSPAHYFRRCAFAADVPASFQTELAHAEVDVFQERQPKKAIPRFYEVTRATKLSSPDSANAEFLMASGALSAKLTCLRDVQE